MDASLNGEGGGPYLTVNRRGNIINGAIAITSIGLQEVPNPAYGGVGSLLPKTIPRDYGFGGSEGNVTIGGVSIPIIDWADDVINVDATGVDIDHRIGHQLVVTKADGTSTITGVTVQVGLRKGANVCCSN